MVRAGRKVGKFPRGGAYILRRVGVGCCIALAKLGCHFNARPFTINRGMGLIGRPRGSFSHRTVHTRLPNLNGMNCITGDARAILNSYCDTNHVCSGVNTTTATGIGCILTGTIMYDMGTTSVKRTNLPPISPTANLPFNDRRSTVTF